MRIEGEYVIRAPLKRVKGLLAAPEELGACLPGLEGFEERGERNFRARVTPGFSFFKGTLTLDMEVGVLQENRMELRTRGKGIGSTFEMRTEIRLEGKGGETVLRLTSEAAFGGLLKPIPESLLKAAAEEVTREILACMERKARGP
jgi:carbon monoxide dehydrogenase subunit G